ncbi:TonB family protein [Achromobacter dolens]|uniref:TonB family protein n=1 Tax=Achromobacter dolens TaxID=1287738 RepID=UPI0015821912|nr:TonB family protein [Achromobacter dolens]MCZ8407407.1 TonB family protein [Achromobacter dolens]
MRAEIFDTLGIEPTDDQKAIRRAYAVALKQIDQAADPERFAALRSAYELARAWAERQQAGDAEFALSGAPFADDGHERPEMPGRAQTPDVHTELTPPSADESAEGIAQERPEMPSRAQESDVHADSTPHSPDESAEGIAHWTHQLMQAPDDQVAQLLDSALSDIRLGHLEARDGLAFSLARALREQPDGRLALFNTARRVFDWNGVNAPFPHDLELSGWIAMLVDQSEHYSHLPLPLRVRLDAVLMMARRSSQPTTMQAIWHGEAFEQLLSHAPDLSVLDLGGARIHAWRGACARVARIRNIPRWLSENRVKLALTAVCVIGLVFMYQDARDGTTYKEPPPARAKLIDGVVTVQAIRAAPEAKPCAVPHLLSSPLGCPAPQLHETTPEVWPTAMPSTLVITRKPPMPYPYEAKLRAVKGKVWVRVLLDEQGQVQRTAMQFSSGNGALDDASVRAAAQMQLMPAMLNGSGIPSQAVLMFDYAVGAP